MAPAVSFAALLETTARARSDAPALIWDGGALSYRDLDARAGGLASTLVTRGLRPGDRVAVVHRRLVAPVGDEVPAGRFEKCRIGAPDRIDCDGLFQKAMFLRGDGGCKVLGAEVRRGRIQHDVHAGIEEFLVSIETDKAIRPRNLLFVFPV